jgi:hypothetical protein
MKNVLLKRSMVIGILILFIGASLIPSISGSNKQNQNQVTIKNDISKPMFFTENNGQFAKDVLFQIKTLGATVYLCKEKIVSVFSRPSKDNSDQREVLSIVAELINANPDVTVIGKNVLPHKNNYFIGNNEDNWYTDVSNYEAVYYKDVYSGVDLKFYIYKNSLKYDFYVKPGADPSVIQIQYKGIENLKKTSAGDIEIGTAFGQIFENKPLIYQDINGVKKEISGQFKIINSNVFGFALDEEYDNENLLIIDPTLVYSTYLGGSTGYDWGYDIAVDSNGNTYTVGNTDSTDFPLQNPCQLTNGGTTDVFISKLSSSGNSLVYSTYLGGLSSDEGYGIDIDSSGHAYITGVTYSNNYPTFTAIFPNLQGVQDAFVTKLHPSGNSLIYSTYLGGTDWEWGTDIVVDSNNQACVIGWTTSFDYPVYNAYDTNHNGGLDAFVTLFDQPGGGLLYSTYLGGFDNDVGTGIDIDSSGNAYITGYTWSSNYPVSPTTAYDSSYNGGGDIVVTILDTTTSGSGSLVYSTFIYGQGDDFGYDIKVDSNGIVYVTGETGSTINQFFPVTSNAYQQFLYGARDAFFFKLDYTLTPPYPTQMLYCSYLGGMTGGSGYDMAWSIDLDSNNNAYIVGTTECSDFPLVNSLGSYNGGNEAFTSLFDPTAFGTASLLDSTYIGGTGHDEGQGIAIDNNDDAYVTGGTYSTDFPTLNPYQGGLAGASDAFITKIAPSWANTPPNKPSTPTGPIKGKPGSSYPYQTNATDPDGHKVRYGWDWDGDNSVDQWVDNGGAYYTSGVTIMTNHSWTAQATYAIKVKAEDVHGAQSVWSDPLTVEIPRSRSIISPRFLLIFEQFTIVYKLLSKLLI